MFGTIQSYESYEDKVVFNFEHGCGIIEIITPSIINIFSSNTNRERLSTAIENLKIEKCNWQVNEVGDNVIITTDRIKINVTNDYLVDIYDRNGNILCEDYRGKRKPFIRRGEGDIAGAEGHQINKVVGSLNIEVIKKMDGDEFFYGLGDKTGHLNKKGYHYKTWNTDDPSPQVESFEALYKAIPFFITLKQKEAYGIFFDNTYETHFDMGKENSDYYYFGADEGNLDYYFIYGPSVVEVMHGYTYLTGTTPLPQMWTLGYQQCRWSYSSEARLLEVANSFREKNIPCDALYLDIDYMDNYKVFTWDNGRFPDPQVMTNKLKEEGFKLVTIIDPGVKKEKGYSIYEEGLENKYFATDKDGIPYVNTVWPGESLFPDFCNSKTRQWWSNNQKIMMDYGIAGIWNDMNEPASFNGPLPDDVQFDYDGIPVDHREIHNIYGHFMSKATFEGIEKYTDKRPFVITRACYAGTQKYSTVWTGDNQSFWESLRTSLPMQMNLGLSGLSFCGTDVGGFGFDCTPELLSRWVQVGCFTPLFRNHSSVYTRDQEPWAFDEQTEEINRKYIQLRYTLIPYLYDLMWDGEKTGLPVMRPVFMYAQDDVNTYELNDQFMFGENILVSPVVQQGQRAKAVYLPKGNWVDYWTKEVFEGGKSIIKETPLDTCPIYVKSGSIIPNYPVQNYVGEKEIKTLLLDIYPGNGKYTHYQDDEESFEYRNGVYNLYEFKMEEKENLLIDINICQTQYAKQYNQFELRINNVESKKVLVNGKECEFKHIDGMLVFTVDAEHTSIEVVLK